MRNRVPGIDTLSDAVRTKLWPIPAAAVVCAVVAGIVLTRLEQPIETRLPSSLTRYLFAGDAAAARTVLDSIAGSMITVTALTFSLTVVTLQLASGQFSPRLLRTFTRDRLVHTTLALFLATFTFALTVLRTVGNSVRGQPASVPNVAVTVAFVLTVASVLGLVLFLAHLARQIRIETMLHGVHSDATATLRRVRADNHGAHPTELPSPGPSAVTLTSGASGFLVSVERRRLLSSAVRADAVILLDQYPGCSVIEGTPIGSAWHRTGSTLDPESSRRLVKDAAEAIGIGVERTPVQDIGFGLRQLTDVALKALSPGINDPTTATHALSHTSALLVELADLDPGIAMLRDAEGVVRVVLHGPNLADLLDEAVTQPRRYGAADPFVLARIFKLLRELAWHLRDAGHHAIIRTQLGRLCATVNAQDFDDTETTHLAMLAQDVEQALHGYWSAPPDSYPYGNVPMDTPDV